MANATVAGDMPPLPAYTLQPMPDLLPFISDFWLTLVLPHIFYWIVSFVFHLIDAYDLFPNYRLHTPEEITARNHASRTEVARDVLVEQVIQIVSSALLTLTEPVPMVGRTDYDVAVWAQRIRRAQRALPTLLGLLGLNAAALAKSVAPSHPLLAGALSGGHYPFLTTTVTTAALDAAAAASGSGSGPAAAAAAALTHVPAFAAWELLLAKALYWVVLPTAQFWFAVGFMDAWQYFWHRLMHVNKWMYVHWHSRHHRLYVPYAYGALYNHPVEGFVLDTAGAGLAYKVACLSPRMGMFFFVFSTVKTVDDHCGYALPWDPLQRITSNNAAYHDIHHQSWGIKTNFSQPFFTFWDRLLGTMWQGDTQLRYARDRDNAAKKVAGSAANAANAANTANTANTASAGEKAAPVLSTPAGAAAKPARSPRAAKSRKA
ncbi:sphinganine hydroxylase [Niveomyces insectorum RCEF 264]|uniref:Sphinganine hydroxylase n=1 Tax=Niveomyces insectorum RCEF 264 TaxID=1081102 RepID=A0A162IC93_9HYPO|nr:sphinganine hydroxylase [Niveomyces insectorum RCEF 264]